MTSSRSYIRVAHYLLAAGLLAPGAALAQPKTLGPSRSTTIALARKDKILLAVNRETNSLAVIAVKKRNQDVSQLIAEVAVGQEPRCVALGPKDKEAYVTNTASGTVSVVSLTGKTINSVVATIPVGTEPRGCATTASRKLLFVANHTQGTVSIIDTRARTVIDTVQLGGNPTAIAITNDGDKDDSDETVFVTDFYAELIPGGPGETFDNGKRGVVQAFSAGARTPNPVTLSPIANVGFTGDRKQFCPQLGMLAGPMMNLLIHSDVFCPDPTETDPNAAVIAMDPQGAFPNQLGSILIRGNRVFVPNIGAGPEPPVRFNVNVQALVHVIDREPLGENTALHVNLNDQIKAETQPNPAVGSLDRLFGNDLVAIDANRDGTLFLIVSRGGNYVLRAGVDANGKLDIGEPNNVVRFQTGNLPNGVVINKDATRAYVNNEANVSVTSINLQAGTVLNRDIPAGTPPEPGTFTHAVLLGKLAFFTALGIPENDIFGTPIREIIPLEHRNKASDNGWSGCGSCHPDGLADGVTWIFGTGPRQTVPLDAFFAKDNPGDQRISNYSAVMGSITDFNNNSRGVQGGAGFAVDPADVFQHGFTQGVSDALDAMTLWVQTVRAPILPQPTNAAGIASGRTVFDAQCASCHGGAKWSKSQTVYRNNPTFATPPVVGTLPLDPGLTNAAAQIVSFTVGANTLQFLEPVGTFDNTVETEIRSDGQLAAGGIGFNSPSLLGIAYHAPYFHDGSAQTLDDVFANHNLGAGTIASTLNAGDEDNLKLFLNSLDGRTVPFKSATDDFLDALTP